jgi:hypothetical protein
MKITRVEQMYTAVVAIPYGNSEVVVDLYLIKLVSTP